VSNPNYILGLDLGTNSIGWALLQLGGDGRPCGYLDGGVRIFPRAVEDKTPTPKNAKRRGKRLARRLLERRARRRRRLEHFLIKKGLLPAAILVPGEREKALNALGDPYVLRARALDEALAPHELGRVLLHLGQRRGFQSNRKTLLKELVDDPDAADLIEELEQSEHDALDSEETEFKRAIAQLSDAIRQGGKRTLGEYLAGLDPHSCRRNRKHAPEDLRTSRRMYREEFALIQDRQLDPAADLLTSEDWAQIEYIIFHQRPLRFRADRMGKCEFEPKNRRAHRARLEFQRFRYLQDVNNLQYFEGHAGGYLRLSGEQRDRLLRALEHSPDLTWAKARKIVGLDRTQKFNLENSEVKKLYGNRTACAVRDILGDSWDDLDHARQHQLVDDLITIKNRSVLKNRLLGFWGLPRDKAVRLAIVELEPDHGNLSLKAIRRILPHLEAGKIYTDALQAAGYQMRKQTIGADDVVDYLPPPPETRNPVVNKALHELRKLINAIVKLHGKPAAIRLEMARELKMNRRQLAAHNKQQTANTKANEEGRQQYQAIHGGGAPAAGRSDQVSSLEGPGRMLCLLGTIDQQDPAVQRRRRGRSHPSLQSHPG
jgi:CRISPR-associated endonuclease Csn1